MKTTIDIPDALLSRAKKHARKAGKSLRLLVEEGLRLVLEDRPASGYTLPDRSVGKAGGTNPLEGMSWQDVRDEIYGGR